MSARDFVRTFAAAFAATVVLTGCEPAADTPEAPEAADGPEAEAAPDAPQLRWEPIASGEGSALMLMDAGDVQVFHLACLSQPARVVVRVRDFTIVGSEERLTLGAGNEAFALVADTQSDEPGVSAEGAIDPMLLDHLARTTEISAVYGAQRAGPYNAPDAETLSNFVTACRDIAAGGVGA